MPVSANSVSAVRVRTLCSMRLSLRFSGAALPSFPFETILCKPARRLKPIILNGQWNRGPVLDTKRRFAPSLRRSAAKAGGLLAGARHIFGITAAVLVNALGRQFQHAVGQCGQEMPVMRDEQHGALV